jgi:hypothetical protein
VKCHDIIELISCNPITRLCAEGKCPSCPGIENTYEQVKDEGAVTYFTWKKGTKYYEKVAETQTGREVVESLKQMI